MIKNDKLIAIEGDIAEDIQRLLIKTHKNIVEVKIIDELICKHLRGVNSRKLIRRIQSVLSINLLKPEFRKVIENEYMELITWGHCYVATEAAYYLFAKNLGFVPYVVRNGKLGTHWWLQHVKTGKILDPTFPQINNKTIYKNGHRANFLTKKPSKRCRELLRRISIEELKL